MQSATGQYGTQAGDPAQPVQHSVMTASSLGRFLRGVAIPSDFGSILTTAVDMPRIMTQTPVSGHARRIRGGANSLDMLRQPIQELTSKRLTVGIECCIFFSR